MDEIIFINVKLNGVCRLIDLKKEEYNNGEKICEKIFQTFDLDTDAYISFEFVNNHLAPISLEDMPKLIYQYKNSGGFYLKLILDQPTLSIKAEGIRNYLIESGNEKMFDEYQLMGDLTKQSRKMLTDGMYHYLLENLSDLRDKQEITDSCAAMISLFPSLSINEFYNAKGKKGSIFNRIKNAYAKKDPVSLTTNEQELIDTLKDCVVAKDKAKLKIILGQTIQLRKKLLRENKEEFADFMSFYFADIELIEHDFGLFHPAIDAKALRQRWHQLLATPISDWKENVDLSIIPAKDDEIWKFFIFFDKFKSPRSRFYTNVKSLIVFSKETSDDPMQLMNHKSRGPYIIAVLSPDRMKAKYYIDVHRHLVSAPENFAFVDAVDLLYKVHKVFDLDFSPAIKHLMDFLDCFVYNNEFDDASITATMRKINNDFLAVSIE